MQLPRLAPGCPMQVVVVAAGAVVGVVHATSAVGAPALVGSCEGPELALPDQVLHVEGCSVLLHPVRDRPAQFEGLTGGGLADRVAEGAVTCAPEWVLGAGTGSW